MDRLLQAKIERDPLIQRATEWFFELRSDTISGERIVEWQQWLSEDAAHLEAFSRVEALWHLSDGAISRWPTEAEVARDDYSGEETVSAWRARAEPAAVAGDRRSRHWTRWLGLRTSLAGVFAAAASVLAFLYWPTLLVALEGGTRVVVQTQVGETRTIILADGSEISAGGESDLVATLLKHSRTVVLERGEAFFHVAKDPKRPFTVHAGKATVTDIGTAFAVQRMPSGLVVAVAEGFVRVSAPPRSSAHDGPAVFHLKAGQRLSLKRYDDSPVLSTVNPTWIGGWREGRLQYVDEPLDDVVADIARYSRRRIIIGNPEIARLRITGVLFMQNINGWLASLQATFPVQVQTRADGSTVIEPR